MTLNVGIDFGTSNSGVALYDGRDVKLLPVDTSSSMPEVIRTILYITREYECHIGQEAIELYYRHNVNRPRRYVKQVAGEIEYYGAEMAYVREVYVYVDELLPGRLLQYLKTALRKDVPGGYKGTRIFERFYSVGDLIELYLAELKHRSEKIVGDKIHAVTLGRPVKFSESHEADQKAEETLRQAALAVGFTHVDFELEPVAAAIFYEKSLDKPENVLVFDFGGGTLDIAVMRLGDPAGRIVYASGGIDIAGSDFDRAIIQMRMLPFFGHGKVFHQPEILEIIQAIPNWISIPELGTPQNRSILEKAIRTGLAPVQMKALQSLIYDDLAFSFYNRVEAAKISLSNQGAEVISLDDQNISLWDVYTRYQFEKDIFEYEQRIKKVLLDTVAASGLEKNEIDAVLKTGGSSSIPLFTSMLKQIFGRRRVKESDVFGSVAAGLAIKAWNNGANR
jgi:hypothetical chaperone protein